MYCSLCLKKKARGVLTEAQTAARASALEQAKQRRIENRQWLFGFKQYRRCQLCGESDPCCLDLVAPETGDPYGAALCNEAVQTVQAIAEKSEVICANCARKRGSRRDMT